jgi:predicted nicotinamide N-methyase
MTFEQKSFNQLTKAYLANFDVIIGADICFWDELSQQLFNLIRRAQGAGVSQTILADPCRSPFETLAARSAAAFKSVERIEAGISRPTKATGALLIVRAAP